MKKNAEKLIAAIVVTTIGLSPVSYPVHAQEETEANVPRTMEHVNGQELLCNVRTDTTAENNAGDFNVTGGTSGTDWTYDSADRELTFLTGGTYTVTGDGQESPDRIVVAGAFDGTIVIRNINAREIHVEGTATLLLMIDGENTLRAGLRFDTATTGSLTIDSDTGGKLTAIGEIYESGIGGGSWQEGNNITIQGGIITAIGGSNASGIGSGTNANGRNITISGGEVIATGGINGAGIGGGFDGGGSNIAVVDGSLKTSSISGVPTDGNGNNVYLAKVDALSGVNSVTVDQDQIFTRAGNHPEEDGAFYLYLTGEDHLITTGDQIFLAEWDEETSTFTVREKAPDPNVTIRSKTAAGITVEPLTDTDRYGEAEYSMDGNTWQTSNVFTELEAGTEYIVYARYKGNDAYVRSDAGSTTVTTMKDGNLLIAEPDGLTGKEGQTLSEITLSGGWTWNDETIALAAGTQTYPARFDTADLEAAYDFTNVDGYDPDGHFVERVLTVEVAPVATPENNAPTIEADDRTITVGDRFDAMSGVSASDVEDGDLSNQIQVIRNTVDTSKAGEYEVTYSVTDAQGATAEKTIKVTVRTKTTGDTKDPVVTGAQTNAVMWFGTLIAAAAAIASTRFRKHRS